MKYLLLVQDGPRLSPPLLVSIILLALLAAEIFQLKELAVLLTHSF